MNLIEQILEEMHREKAAKEAKDVARALKQNGEAVTENTPVSGCGCGR